MSDYEMLHHLVAICYKEFKPDEETKVIFGEFLNEADQKRVIKLLESLLKTLK